MNSGVRFHVFTTSWRLAVCVGSQAPEMQFVFVLKHMALRGTACNSDSNDRQVGCVVARVCGVKGTRG